MDASGHVRVLKIGFSTSDDGEASLRSSGSKSLLKSRHIRHSSATGKPHAVACPPL
jgi:hypothetical protein